MVIYDRFKCGAFNLLDLKSPWILREWNRNTVSEFHKAKGVKSSKFPMYNAPISIFFLKKNVLSGSASLHFNWILLLITFTVITTGLVVGRNLWSRGKTRKFTGINEGKWSVRERRERGAKANPEPTLQGGCSGEIRRLGSLSTVSIPPWVDLEIY